MIFISLKSIFLSITLVLSTYSVNCRNSLNNARSHNISKRAIIDKPVVVGYMPSWSARRSGIYKFDVNNVKADSLTHLIYAFINVKADGSLVHPENSAGQYKQMQELKRNNPNLKIVPSVGGATYTWAISAMAASDSSLQNFARSVKLFVEQYGFDGIDIDWEFPNAGEKRRYSKMLEVLRQELGSDMIIMSAVPAGQQNFAGFDPSAMNEYLDLICVMTYDFHGPGWESQTGHNAPLYSNNDLSAEGAMNLWKKFGVTPEKLVVGLAFYGKSWTLARSSNNGVGARSVGEGLKGPIGETGTLRYVEIENMPEWQEQWDDTAKVPYAYHDNQWVSYDNLKSLSLKCEFACQNGYAGVMIWDLASDSQASLLPSVYNDVMSCGGGNGTAPRPPSGTTTRRSSSATQTTRRTTTRGTTTRKSGGGGSCPSDPSTICEGLSGGLVPYPPDCGQYMECTTRQVMPCPGGLHFNPSFSGCDWPQNVNCEPC